MPWKRSPKRSGPSATEEQLARYQPWFDNARRLKDLLAKLEAASLHALERAEDHTKQVNDTASPATTRRRRPPR